MSVDARDLLGTCATQTGTSLRRWSLDSSPSRQRRMRFSLSAHARRALLLRCNSIPVLVPSLGARSLCWSKPGVHSTSLSWTLLTSAFASDGHHDSQSHGGATPTLICLPPIVLGVQLCERTCKSLAASFVAR